ncbi:transporter (NhaC family) [Sediminitomix flava]|uniref:Transporter (NhaC family) n=2 Tax=Sediminitomix flava TaxID=379075 RepID=A0A315ZA49_SEDFL|nr:transporter (NhaC family) [Sediminitomix flava]
MNTNFLLSVVQSSTPIEHMGYWSLLPTIVVIILAIYSKKTFESLLLGAIVGFVLLKQELFFKAFTSSLLGVMNDEVIGWVILVCGLFGSLIHLLVKSGGAMAFADYVSKYIKSKKGALVITWLLGLSIFIDDYLNALTVGSSMKKVTDKFKVSREMLAYIVDSTAAPVCVLVPFSTWAIYVSGLLETQGMAPQGEGLQAYLSAIPYFVYGWVAFLIVPLVAMGIIPAFGPMKKAEKRAQEGQLAPNNSEAISLSLSATNNDYPSNLLHFVLPIIVLITATIVFDTDALMGVITAISFTVIYYTVAKVMTVTSAMKEVFEGLKSMVYALGIIIMSFVLKDVNEALGLTQFIIDMVSPWMSKALLPAIAFTALALITFATGSFWGTYAISLPIMIPLSQSLGVDPWLSIGAVVSAGAFGSHACFYGDTTVLSSSASGCNNIAHVMTQLPYALLAGGISTLIYLILGFIA